MSDDLVSRIRAREDPGSNSRAPIANARAGRLAREKRAGFAQRERFKAEKDIRRRLFLLEEMLRNQPGIHTRLPSHINPPFRAERFTSEIYQTAINATTTNPAFLTVTFNGNVAVPAGYRCEIVEIWVASSVQAAIGTENDPATTDTWSLLINGQGFPGCRGRAVAGWIFDNATTASHFPQPSALHFQQAASVHLEQGERAVLSVTNGSAAQHSVSARVSGWIYPVRAEGEGIRATVSD